MGLVMGEVISSRHSDYVVGDWLMARIAWEEYSVADDSQFIVKIDSSEPYPMNYYLGVLGDTGLSAYFGMADIGKPQPGETVLVSAAGGAVGSIAGQIARIYGARAVGIVGTKAKADRLVAELDYDDVIVHTGNLDEQLRATCPEGVDVYFDNVGGEMLDAAILNMKPKGRIVVSGQVSEYNREKPVGMRQTTRFITHRLRMEGLVVYDYAKQFPEAQAAMAALIRDGKLAYKEDISEGIKDAPSEYAALFAGANFGRRLIKTI